jgi:hypothetical protein
MSTAFHRVLVLLLLTVVGFSAQQKTEPATAQVWISVSGPERYTIQFEGDTIHAERVHMGEQVAAGVFPQTIEAHKSGTLYVGKAQEGGSCAYSGKLKHHACTIEQEIEFSLVTSTRIEGTILAPPAGAKFDCQKCQYSQPNKIQKFAWIPELGR